MTTDALRILKIVATRPREGVARVQNRLGRTSSSTLKVSPNWSEQLVELFPADHRAEMDKISTAIGAAHLYDADPALIGVIYSGTRALKPKAVVETGVARGISTRFILEALEANREGHLWSVDLPPATDDARFAGEEWASAVTRRDRWTVTHGYSRAILPSLLQREIGPIDIFIHDGGHSQPNMLFEYRIAWRYLRPGGLLISDDIHLNAAWETFFNGIKNDVSIVCDNEVKDGLFGVGVRG